MADDEENESDNGKPDAVVGRWKKELESAKKHVKEWHKRGHASVKRFQGEFAEKTTDSDRRNRSRWNLFNSNIQTKQAILFGQTPTVSVERRFDDASDDKARVAAEMLERLLNSDLETNVTTEALSFQYALSDYLLPGFSLVRLRYEFDEETTEEVPAQVDANGMELAPPVPPVSQKVNERVVTEYVHWKDVLWSPCKVFTELRWVGFRVMMSRTELVKRFGDMGKLVPTKKAKEDTTKDNDQAQDPWSRAAVWEIWSSETKEVFWIAEGFDKLLDNKPDPLELKNFWPFPRPMVANLTTESMVPTPEFVLSQDLYDQIDRLTQRIDLLMEAVAVRGVYDKSSPEIKRLLTETTSMRNELLPVDNWAAFSEKGGIQGTVSWLPLEQIIGALDKLSEKRSELVQALYQMTGMSDIMRGQRDPGSKGPVTAAEQSIKARFGSVRMQATQDEFARFVTEAQQLKAEIICRHFDPQTIVEQSNVGATPDVDMASKAVQLMQSDAMQWRVVVKPDAISLTDFAGNRSEAADFIAGLSQFLTAAAPLAQSMPGSQMFLLQLMQLVMSRYKFSDQAEGILDKAIDALRKQQEMQAAQPPQPPPPDPKLQAAQLKASADMQKGQLDLQKQQLQAASDAQRIRMETQAEIQKQQAQASFNTQEEANRARIKVAEARALPGPMPRGGI